MITVLTKIFSCNNARELIEKLSQQDKLSKFCIDAGFLNVVEIGQYVMTKDTTEFSQFTDAEACREYTLPREEGASEPKGWIRGNVTNLNNSEQETSEVQFEEYALKLNASDFACRSKAKTKPQRREPAGSSTRIIPTGCEPFRQLECHPSTSGAFAHVMISATVPTTSSWPFATSNSTLATLQPLSS